MIPEETKNYIDDQVRHSTDSSIQALTILIKEMKDEYRNHREEELSSREIYREKMLKTVEEIVKVTVNGKIDNANKKLDMLIERTAPVIKQYEDNRGFWSTLSTKGKQIGIITSIIGGTAILFNYLIKLSK